MPPGIGGLIAVRGDGNQNPIQSLTTDDTISPWNYSPEYYTRVLYH